MGCGKYLCPPGLLLLTYEIFERAATSVKWGRLAVSAGRPEGSATTRNAQRLDMARTIVRFNYSSGDCQGAKFLLLIVIAVRRALGFALSPSLYSGPRN
jgi:hypothetical protein